MLWDTHQWRIQGVSEVSTEPPFGLHLVLIRSTDDRLTGTPSLVTELRKLLLWLTLACFRRKFIQKSIDWTGSCSQKRSKMGVASKIWHALHAQEYNRTPPSRNRRSTTAHPAQACELIYQQAKKIFSLLPILCTR